MKRRELALLLGSNGDAKLLLRHVFGVSPVDFLLNDADFDEKQLNPFIARLKAGEPLSRMIGRQEFYGLEFLLNEATLIPRPDTESLIDAALPLKPTSILDLGTGSGAILITLLKLLPEASGLGADISIEALDMARKNAEINQVKADFIQTDWFSNVTGTFDLIISNPPYIGRDEALDNSVLNHDPHLALFADNQGLACYEIIFKQAAPFLTEHGHIIVEIGYQQQEKVTLLAKNMGYTLLGVKNDLGGHARALTFKK